jgi:hypothetical protein
VEPTIVSLPSKHVSFDQHAYPIPSTIEVVMKVSAS